MNLRKKMISLALGSLLLTSIPGFTQNVIDTVTTIPIKKYISQLIIQDLLEGDNVKQQLSIYEQLNGENEKTISLQENIIQIKTLQNNKLSLALQKSEEQFKLQQEVSKNLYKELEKQKNKNLFYKIGTFAFILTLVSFIIY